MLFPAQHGGNMASSALRKVWLSAREAAGRPERFHDLRHTGATLAAATGATLAELMARMGLLHARRYQHAAADRDRAIAEALSGFAEARWSRSPDVPHPKPPKSMWHAPLALRQRS